MAAAGADDKESRRRDLPLRSVAQRWAEARLKLEEPVPATPGSQAERAREPPPSPVPSSCLAVPPEELRKASKHYQSAVKQFRDAIGGGAALEEPAAEVLSSYEDCLELLLMMRSGASACLREELREAGAHLTEATASLGDAADPGDAAVRAGVATDCAKDFEKVSLHNRAATRKRITSSLSELRDCEQQLSRALSPPQGAPSDAAEDEDLDLGDSDFQELDPPQRAVVEALVRATTSLETVLQDASQACISGPSSFSGLTALAALEEVALQATAASRSIQGLAACCLGDLDVQGAREAFAALRGAAEPVGTAANCLGGAGQQAGAELIEALEAVDKALTVAAASPRRASQASTAAA